MKTCFRCHVSQPLSEFYLHSECADGHLNKCKTCTKKDAAARTAINKLNPIWLDKERERGRLKARRYHAGIRKTTCTIAVTKKQGKPKPFAEYKRKAHGIYNTALRRGEITRQPCVICGNEKVEGHHEDYAKPLEVIWLCKQHHTELHAARKFEASLARFLTTQPTQIV